MHPDPIHPPPPSRRPPARLRRRLVAWPLALLAAAGSGLGLAYADLPEGWFKDGKAPRQFRAGVDEEVSRNEVGKSAYLQSWTATPPIYGTLMQRVDAERYRGKRVRLAGWLRTEAVDHDEAWAGLWMRIDGAGGRTLAFDNTSEAPVRGTTGWTRVAVVLDVDDRAEAVAFGFMLVGSGRVWADDVSFEEVGDDVPVTAEGRRRLPREPVNLGFDGA